MVGGETGVDEEETEERSRVPEGHSSQVIVRLFSVIRNFFVLRGRLRSGAIGPLLMSTYLYTPTPVCLRVCVTVNKGPPHIYLCLGDHVCRCVEMCVRVPTECTSGLSGVPM